MNVVKINNLAPPALILLLMVAGCAGIPKSAAKTGTEKDPNVIVIHTDDDGCFAADRIGRGRHCKLFQPKTLCAEPGQWIRWITTGNAIEDIDFKEDPDKSEDDPLNSDDCEPEGLTYTCQVKADIDAGTYKYSIKLKDCPLFDPKIIITN